MLATIISVLVKLVIIVVLLLLLGTFTIGFFEVFSPGGEDEKSNSNNR
jgi:hypothetical protein